MAPSQLSIATSSLLRLVKEEASYHKELEQQQSRLLKSEQCGGDENADYTIKQEVRPRVLPYRLVNRDLMGIVKANGAPSTFLETSYRRNESNLSPAKGQNQGRYG